MEKLQQIDYRLRRDWKIAIVFILIGILLGYSAGFAIGAKVSLEWAIDKAFYFFDLKGIEIEADTELIVNAIDSYKGHIDRCYPSLENASIYNNSGN